MSGYGWFRLYHRIIDDEKIRLLAFEDRWHFVAICCLKADGLLDEPESDLKWRKVAVKMGVQARELEEICRRLSEVGLVDEYMQPLAWNVLQYKSDSSADRVRAHREKAKKNKDVTERNGDVTLQKQRASVTVTPPDTDTDTETDVIADAITTRKARESDPKTELMVVLSEEMAEAIVEHRRKLRAPLTARSAKGLATEFSKCPDANAAAETMLVQGWRGFKADWSTERIQTAKRQGKRTFMDAYWDLVDERKTSNFGDVVQLPANGGRS